MRTLAIETATEACSVALFEDGALLAHDHRVLGRGHAERLVPMIAALPGKGRAEIILVSRGPGSFTGTRIGIATARALAFAWQAEIFGFPTLALVAATARAGHSGEPVSVAMTGGHGEWFVQNFDVAGLPETEAQTLAPELAAESATHTLAAGTRAEDLIALTGSGTAIAVHPDARHALSLPSQLVTAETSPIYGRAPDARSMA